MTGGSVNSERSARGGSTVDMGRGDPDSDRRPIPPSSSIGFLILPVLRAMRRRMAASSSRARAVVLVLVGAVFWSLLFAILFRLLRYFRGAAGIGEVLAGKPSFALRA